MLLVTGANGQLGQELKKLLDLNNTIFVSKEQLDITNEKKLSNFFAINKVDTVINCAAYTNVDKAEEDIDNCNKINIDGIENLAKLSVEYNFLLIHISTDYVYDGKNYIPYNELDAVKPLSIYGKSKLQGEGQLFKYSNRAIVIRTSWLYSEFNKNFFKTILNLSNSKQDIAIISDQIGTPTYAYDLAIAIVEIISKINSKYYDEKEVYHFSNEGVASWYDFAYEIVKISKNNCKVKPIKTSEYKTLATRPQYTVLDKSKIKNDFNLEIRHWKDALIECFSKIEK